MPATTLRDVIFEPAMPEPAAAGHRHAEVRRRDENRPAIRSRAWRKRGKPRAFGTPLQIGAVWDGNEEQAATETDAESVRLPGILTLLAGGGASAATQRNAGAPKVRRGWCSELSWIDLGQDTHDGVVGNQLGARTMVARRIRVLRLLSFPHRFATALARPFGRMFFAGEHTSLRWQGYMNGAVETGLRAAEEVLRANG